MVRLFCTGYASASGKVGYTAGPIHAALRALRFSSGFIGFGNKGNRKMIGAQAILILFNILNAFFDASRIKRGIKIQHWINFLLYGISIGLILYFKIRPF
jgi:hypothetical protein